MVSQQASTEWDGRARELTIFSREWAVLLPAYFVVVFLLAYFVYFALDIYGAPSLSDTCIFTGEVVAAMSVQSMIHHGARFAFSLPSCMRGEARIYAICMS